MSLLFWETGQDRDKESNAWAEADEHKGCVCGWLWLTLSKGLAWCNFKKKGYFLHSTNQLAVKKVVCGRLLLSVPMPTPPLSLPSSVGFLISTVVLLLLEFGEFLFCYSCYFTGGTEWWATGDNMQGTRKVLFDHHHYSSGFFPPLRPLVMTFFWHFQISLFPRH